MARIKYMEIPRSDLNEVKIVAGQVIHCLDTGECFYDNANTIRILSEFIIPVGNINEVSVPTVNRLYIDSLNAINFNIFYKKLLFTIIKFIIFSSPII